jgi:hypothetical protein
MRGHFRYLRFKTFQMTPKTPQCEVFWALLSNPKHSGVPEDSKSPTLGMLGFNPTLGQSGVTTHLGVSRQKAILMPLPWSGAEYIIWGKVVASPESGPWWVLWVRGRPWLVLVLKVLQPCANQLVYWFYAGSLEWMNYLSLFLIPSWNSNTPFYPSKMLRVREHALNP